MPKYSVYCSARILYNIQVEADDEASAYAIAWADINTNHELQVSDLENIKVVEIKD
jgi:hypothetical protein